MTVNNNKVYVLKQGTLLAGTFNVTSQVIKDQISGLHIEYELPSCRIVRKNKTNFIPADITLLL